MLLAITTADAQYPSRRRISLHGEWQTSLGEAWLPGTTDTNRLGEGNSDTTQTHALTRLYPYVGRVRYSRTVTIPKAMAGRNLRLVIERTKPSTLYIDGDSIGSQGHIYAPHIYDIAPLSQGEHRIDIIVDNSASALPAEIFGSHAMTDATQTNWNGMLGEMYIEELPATRIERVEVYPDTENRTATILLYIYSSQPRQSTISCDISSWNTPQPTHRVQLHHKSQLHEGENRIEIVAPMGERTQLWSEFHPALYRCQVELKSGKGRDKMELDFGMRNIESRDGALWLNGKRIFLRGKHDAAVFPLTGYPPMDCKSWIEYLTTLKNYGINHIRCHSYTPPRAAFEAADIVGIYIQSELPLWGSIEPGKRELNDFLMNEGGMLLQWAGNHPSFAFVALGNELNGDISLMREMIELMRKADPRHLYAMGANNFLGWQGPQQGEDIYIACRNGWAEQYAAHLRSSFAFVDAEEGGAINGLRPSTREDYTKALEGITIPVVGHETGQFQIYPDYSEIDSYTGILHPYNLKAFRRKLHSRGMAHRAHAFQQATGEFAVECYKADIEYALRTKGMDGYQILDIQDYPGQGTALVGILTATMQDKGVVSAARWRQWCSAVVPLALFDSYCIEAQEGFRAELMVFNYSEEDLHEPLRWELTSETVPLHLEGEADALIPQGDVARAGSIALTLPHSPTPYTAQLTLRIADHTNSYRLWIYPAAEAAATEEVSTAAATAAATTETAAVEGTGDLLYADTLSEELFGAVEQGATLILSPDHTTIAEQSVGGLFTPDYWNYSMFRSISEGAGKPISPGTLGILCDPSHPLFGLFPTEAHSDWQWWAVARNSRPLILDDMPTEVEPLVQVIDNIERGHRLGILFEFRAGKGKIILSTTDFDAIAPCIEGRWWQRAIADYAASERCQPTQEIGYEQLHSLLYGKREQENITGVKNISDYSSPQP